jgi:TPR repeat protein
VLKYIVAKLFAEIGYAGYQVQIGNMHYNGHGVPQDYAEAAKWYRRAAEQGNVYAQSILGAMYANGQGFPQDYAEAAKWFRKAAEQGEATAQCNLGTMYDNGQGIPQDYAEAVKWFRKAADQGFAPAQGALGSMYFYGHGFPQDYAEAAKWFRKAAEQGDAAAQTNLGVMYCNGHGILQDYAEAVKWYRKAADQGNEIAQTNLGVMYCNGQGVPQDYAEAVKWHRMAAEQGDAGAQDKHGRVNTDSREPEEEGLYDLECAVDDAPVVKLVNYILTEAIKRRASDIHIEPYEKEFRIRERGVDGVLYETMRPPLRLHNAISSRVKIMAKMDIVEKRLPQDGSIGVRVGGRSLDLRVSTIHTSYGEKVVIRILDSSNVPADGHIVREVAPSAGQGVPEGTGTEGQAAQGEGGHDIMNSMYVRSIDAILKALEAKDFYTRGHSQRVTLYSVAIGEELGMAGQELEDLYRASVLHDLGKIGVRDAVLNKPGKLSEEEFTEILRHPETAVRILEPIPFFGPLLPAILHHHERFDGKGYPSRLAGNNIPLASRIITIANTFDAMTSTTAYRKALPVADAIAEIRRCSGTQFDPDIVAAFLACQSKIVIPGDVTLPEGFEDAIPFEFRTKPN